MKTKTKFKFRKNLRIAIILDQSSSMSSRMHHTTKSFNNLLNHCLNHKGSVKFSLTLFNSNQIECRYRNVDIQTVEALNSYNYKPNGMTPLYDAIESTIKEINHEKKVLLIILTDGMENCSKYATKQSVHRLISEMKDKKKWNVVFLGAELDDLRDADNIGITRGKYSISDEHISDSLKIFYKMYMKSKKLDYDVLDKKLEQQK